VVPTGDARGAPVATTNDAAGINVGPRLFSRFVLRPRRAEWPALAAGPPVVTCCFAVPPVPVSSRSGRLRSTECPAGACRRSAGQAAGSPRYALPVPGGRRRADALPRSGIAKYNGEPDGGESLLNTFLFDGCGRSPGERQCSPLLEGAMVILEVCSCSGRWSPDRVDSAVVLIRRQGTASSGDNVWAKRHGEHEGQGCWASGNPAYSRRPPRSWRLTAGCLALQPSGTSCATLAVLLASTRSASRGGRDTSYGPGGC